LYLYDALQTYEIPQFGLPLRSIIISQLQELNFPKYNFDIKREENQLFVFDEIRKKWIVLTPEEWVRQHVIFYLVDQKKFPASLIAVEKAIKVNQRLKRFDLVCYDNQARPVILVECKAPEIKISVQTMAQALRYNSQIQAEYVVLTNGLDLVCAQIDHVKKEVNYLQDLPEYKI
jgi:hypothetical protein